MRRSWRSSYRVTLRGGGAGTLFSTATPGVGRGVRRRSRGGVTNGDVGNGKPSRQGIEEPGKPRPRIAPRKAKIDWVGPEYQVIVERFTFWLPRRPTASGISAPRIAQLGDLAYHDITAAAGGPCTTCCSKGAAPLEAGQPGLDIFERAKASRSAADGPAVGQALPRAEEAEIHPPRQERQKRGA